MPNEILVVDDEADIRELIGGILEDEGYVARFAKNSDEATEAFQHRRPDLVLLDIWLQGSKLDGLEVLDIVKGIDETIPVVMISGHGTIETAVSALKRGAYDFIEKPFNTERLLIVVQRALETFRLRNENQLLKQRSFTAQDLLGESTAIHNLRANIDKVAPMNSRVLISGPSGSGKEVVARLIHNKSHRAKGPFEIISSSTISPERMEVELFGEEGADGRPIKIGVFERAHNGTLLLDEIADMPYETQTKILRVLIEQKFKRVGSNIHINVDVRVISSTSKNLIQLIEQGKFREDLFHRLNVVPIKVPGLSERREDLPMIIKYFAERIAVANGIANRDFTTEAIAAMQTANWPGNVRELRNMIERLLILTPGDEPIDVEQIYSENSNSGDSDERTKFVQLVSLPLREARETFEREYLAAQVARFGGNISKTATFIGMERSALHRKLKSLAVEGLRVGDVD